MTWLVGTELVATGTPFDVRGIALGFVGFGFALAVPLADAFYAFVVSVDENLLSDDLLSWSVSSDEVV